MLEGTLATRSKQAMMKRKTTGWATFSEKVIGLCALLALLGTQLLIACGGEDGTTVVVTPPQSQAPPTSGAPVTPGPGSAPSAPVAPDYKSVALSDGRVVYVHPNGVEAIVVPARLHGDLLLEHRFSVPSANLGFLSGYLGSTWSEKCQAYRPEAAFQFYEQALEVGEAGEVVRSQEDLRSLLTIGQYDIGVNRLKIAFETDGDARNAVSQAQTSGAWPQAVPKPSSVRALKLSDVVYDVVASTVLPRSLVAHDGVGFRDIEKLPQERIPAFINQYCDLLLGKIEIRLAVKNVKAGTQTPNVPLVIEESNEGVTPFAAVNPNPIRRAFPDGRELYFDASTLEAKLVPPSVKATLNISVMTTSFDFLKLKKGNNLVEKCQDFRSGADVAFEMSKDPKETPAAAEEHRKTGVFLLGLGTQMVAFVHLRDIQFETDAFSEAYLKSNWPADLPPFSKATALKAKDLAYDPVASVQKSQSAAARLAEKEVMEFSRLLSPNTPARSDINNICDLLLGKTRVVMYGQGIVSEEFPITILEPETLQ